MIRSAKITIALSLLFFTWSGCQDAGGPSDDSLSPENADRLILPITTGVMLRLEGLKDSYTLDEAVTGSLLLINLSDPEPFVLFTSNMPPHGFQIYPRESTNLIYFYPSIGMPAEFQDTLRVGDTLSLPLSWGQTMWDGNAQRWTALKPPSGMYRLIAGIGGNPLLWDRRLTKFFTITESGEPLSVWLRVDYTSTDSLKADFLIRNRITRGVILETIDPHPIEVAFVHGQDTLVRLAYALSPDNATIPPQADVTLLALRVGKQDSAIAILGGRFDMRAMLHTRTRTLLARAFTYLP